MATTATESKVTPNHLLGECRHISWTLANGESGDAISFVEFSDKCVQFGGTFGAGGSVTIQGSNDLTAPSNWSTLTDPFDVAVTATSASLEQILTSPLWVRPTVTAGDGTTAITVKLVVRRARGKTS